MVTKNIDLTPEAVAFAMYPKDMRGNYEQRDDFPEYVRMAKVACDMFATRLVEVESLTRGTVMSELKPCPFCGSKNLGLIRHTPMQRAPSVMCRDCNCSATSPERWNTRIDSIPSQDNLILAAQEAAEYILDGMGIDGPDYIIDSDDDFLDAANSKWVRDTLERLAAAPLVAAPAPARVTVQEVEKIVDMVWAEYSDSIKEKWTFRKAHVENAVRRALSENRT